MNAIILAAGKGERLRPFTNDKPKCLVKLFGKTLLEWQINVFQNSGITDITVVTGYRSNLINFPEITILKNEKYATTNMVETLFCAKEKLLDSTIISYGDIIFEKQVLKKLMNNSSDIAVVVDKNWEKYWKMRFKIPLDDAESLKFDVDGFITSIGQKTSDLSNIQAQYIGLMKFQNNGIYDLKNFYTKALSKSSHGINILNPQTTFEKSYMTDLLQAMINYNYQIKSVSIEGGWLELDSVDDYKLYEQKYNDKTLSELLILDNDL